MGGDEGAQDDETIQRMDTNEDIQQLDNGLRACWFDQHRGRGIAVIMSLLVWLLPEVKSGFEADRQRVDAVRLFIGQEFGSLQMWGCGLRL